MNQKNETPLQLAMLNKFEGIADLLLDKGATFRDAQLVRLKNTWSFFTAVTQNYVQFANSIIAFIPLLFCQRAIGIHWSLE